MKYTGTLAKPITRRRLGLLPDDATIQAEIHRTTEEMFAKLPELFKAHGIIENNYVGLAIAMAKEHVPGFKRTNPPGAPTKWSDVDKAELRLAVDEMQEANPGMPDTQAISKVCRLPSWEAKTKGMKVTALRKHYDAADARWIALVKDAKTFNSIAQKD